MTPSTLFQRKTNGDKAAEQGDHQDRQGFPDPDEIVLVQQP